MTNNISREIEKLSWQWQDYLIPYTVSGQGQAVLLIHGFGARLEHWGKNIPVLAEGGYRVYAIDLLGFGAAPKPIINYSLELWQQQLKDFCQEIIQEPTVFVGNSIGALLSLMLLSDFPEIARGGVLLNCAGGLNHRPEELNLPLRLIMGTFSKLVSSPLFGSLIFNNVRRKQNIRRTLYQVYRDPQAVTDELVEMFYQPSCDSSAHKVFASILTAPPGPKPEELLPRLQHPLLVLWGEDDPWTPIQGAAIYQQIADRNTQVEFLAIPQTGHCPHDEKPEIVNPLIRDWLERQLTLVR